MDKTKSFSPLFPPAKKPSPVRIHYSYIPKELFHLHTFIVIGALIQCVLSAILPARWALVPAVLLVLSSVVTTILQMARSTNYYNQGSVYRRATVQIPSQSGEFPSKPAEKQVVVFHLAAQFNHPLGYAAPGAAELGAHFMAMTKEMEKRADEFGLLTLSTWIGSARGSSNTMLIIFYFSDVEGVNRFANDPIHRKGWEWYNKGDFKHIGILHETFLAPPKCYETIYVNCQPELLGRANMRCETGDGTVWVNPLVGCDDKTLKGQYARMGWSSEGIRPETVEPGSPSPEKDPRGKRKMGLMTPC